MNEQLTVSWFSAGVSSAVATKLAIKEIDEIIYINIDDQHSDTIRFVKDCEQWFGKEIKIMQSEVRSVENAILLNPTGMGRWAKCTDRLKKYVRVEWERQQNSHITYIWGMDASEIGRFKRLEYSMPNQSHRCPLIENSISKEHAHQILKASGIKRPAMYDLGYHNNNCIGCVKGGAGYWNHIRTDFPEVFNSRAKLERRIGLSCINGTFLDELDPQKGRHDAPIVDDCGIFCELDSLK